MCRMAEHDGSVTALQSIYAMELSKPLLSFHPLASAPYRAEKTAAKRDRPADGRRITAPAVTRYAENEAPHDRSAPLNPAERAEIFHGAADPPPPAIAVTAAPQCSPVSGRRPLLGPGEGRSTCRSAPIWTPNTQIASCVSSAAGRLQGNSCHWAVWSAIGRRSARPSIAGRRTKPCSTARRQLSPRPALPAGTAVRHPLRQSAPRQPTIA